MTFQTFPIAPYPSYITRMYAGAAGPDNFNGQGTGTARHGIFYEGDTVLLGFQYGTYADSYYVKDFSGTTVATGVAVSGQPINLGSSLPCGWYRLYLEGPSTDSVYGPAYGDNNFIVCPQSANLPVLPASTVQYYNWKPNGFGMTDAEVDAGFSPPAGTPSFGNPPDIITRACMGMGMGRLSIQDPQDPEAGSSSDRISDNVRYAETVLADWWLPGGQYAVDDPVRERLAWVAMDGNTYANGGYDSLALASSNGGIEIHLNIYCKDELIDGSKVFISSGFGTGTGGTDIIKVYYPDASTLVETYDGLTAQATTAAAINAASNYVKVWTADYLSVHPATTSPTAIGRSGYNGTVAAVQALYPLGVTRFEGPQNEPTVNSIIAHRMRLFQKAVHDGHPDAKAIGPCAVNITNLTGWEDFLLAGGGDYCDEIASHSYNTPTNGDLNLGRNIIEAWLDLLAEYGQAGKAIWQTEATHSMCSVIFGIYHPRRARHTMMSTLLWEQYGVPMEKNPYWYDMSHGFWGYPCFAFNTNYSSNPQVALMRTLGAEVFGKNFHHRMDFGCQPANQMFVGNVYGDATTGSCAVMMCASALADSQVTLTVYGTTDPLVVVDGWGNETTATQTAGRITVDVPDVPAYVRLPVGVNVSVYSVNDWGHAPNPSTSATKNTATLGGADALAIANDSFMTVYAGTTASPGITHSTSGLPDSAAITFTYDIEVERVIVWNGPAWQQMPGLYDFDVDTWDGATWTTRKTVTRTTPSSFVHGSLDTGCQRETYWDEQWIEDVKLDTPITCKGVRVYVRGATYGGEPDYACMTDGSVLIAANGMDPPKLAIQEISIISPTAFTIPPEYDTEVLADSPIVYLKCDETTGTTAATEVNSPTLDGVISGSLTLGAEGLVGEGGAFSNGGATTGKVTVPHDTLLNVADTFTLEAWYMPTNSFAGQFRSIIGKGTTAWSLGVNTTGNVYLARQNTGTVVATASAALQVGVSAHIVCTKSGATTKIYVNGIDVTSAGTNVAFGNNSDSVVVLGSTYNDIDAVAIYGTALSGARVQAHYVAGIAPAAPVNTSVPLVAA